MDCMDVEPLMVVCEGPDIEDTRSRDVSHQQNGWDEKGVETTAAMERSEVDDLEDHLEKLEVDHE